MTNTLKRMSNPMNPPFPYEQIGSAAPQSPSAMTATRDVINMVDCSVKMCQRCLEKYLFTIIIRKQIVGHRA